MRIETERLRLYPLTLAQLRRALADYTGVAHAYGATAPPMRFWERHTKRKIHRAKSFLIGCNPKSWALTTSWFIIVPSIGKLIGEVGFKGSPTDRRAVEIGYNVFECFRGNGYMSEAVDAMVRFAFFQTDYQVDRIKAFTLPKNIASHRVLEKNGFARKPTVGRYWLWERERLSTDTDKGIFF